MSKGVLAAIITVLVHVAPAHASLAPPPDCPRPIPKWDGGSDRIVAGESGTDATTDSYLAVLPESYRDEPTRRYPVIYLLHGVDSVAEEYLRCIRLVRLMADDDVIVVLPQGTPFGFWIDWHSGEQLRESALLEMIDAVDARFRTVPKPGARAIGGLSMGGYGAMVQAVRHPELFGAAASFSGAIRSADSSPGYGAFVYGLETAIVPGAFADPATPEGREWRAAHDPVGRAQQLRGKWVFLGSGTGVPCDGDEAKRFGELDPTMPVFEPLFRSDHRQMEGALLAAKIQHVSRRYKCGAHTFPTFQRALEDAWPGLVRAIGGDDRRLRSSPTRGVKRGNLAGSGPDRARRPVTAG